MSLPPAPCHAPSSAVQQDNLVSSLPWTTLPCPDGQTSHVQDKVHLEALLAWGSPKWLWEQNAGERIARHGTPLGVHLTMLNYCNVLSLFCKTPTAKYLRKILCILTKHKKSGQRLAFTVTDSLRERVECGCRDSSRTMSASVFSLHDSQCRKKSLALEGNRALHWDNFQHEDL